MPDLAGEDGKLVTLARSTRARTRATVGAAHFGCYSLP